MQEKKLVGRTKHGELTLDQLASIQPGMARLMAEVGHRYSMMIYACKGGNWELGHYALRQLRGVFQVAATTRPKYRTELEAFDREYLGPIEKAIREKNVETFMGAVERGIAESDEVHRRLGYAFIRYRLPARPPDNLDFGPGSES